MNKPTSKNLLAILVKDGKLAHDYVGKIVIELNVSQGGVTDAKISKTEKL